MKTSDTQSALIAALIKSQKVFPVITKTKEGQNGNRKFKYAPLEEVLDAVRPVLLDNGILLTQAIEGHEIVTRLDHISGEWREASMPVNAEHASMQSYGVELTYRRRYAIQPMLGIMTEEDTDGKGADKRKGKDFSADSGISHSAPAIIFSELQPDVQDYLRRNAPKVAQAMPDAAEAKRRIEQILNDWPDEIRNELKVGVWYLLDSKTRSAIKTHESEQRATKPAHQKEAA
jgi:hypothetical protein